MGSPQGIGVCHTALEVTAPPPPSHPGIGQQNLKFRRILPTAVDFPYVSYLVFALPPCSNGSDPIHKSAKVSYCYLAQFHSRVLSIPEDTAWFTLMRVGNGEKAVLNPCKGPHGFRIQRFSGGKFFLKERSYRLDSQC